MDCVFCKIINKELPAEIVYENNEILVFKDINPKAPIHLLIVPKKHIPSVNQLKSEDKNLAAELLLVAKNIANEKGIDKTGYKLVFNVGKGGGQEISHLHLHFLAGWDNDNEKERDVPGMP